MDLAEAIELAAQIARAAVQILLDIVAIHAQPAAVPGMSWVNP